MDIEKALFRIAGLERSISTYNESIGAHHGGRASLQRQISEGFDEIRDYLQSNGGPCDPFHYSLVRFGRGFNDVLPRLEDFAKVLENIPGSPIVIHACEPVPVKKEEGQKGTDHVSGVKAEILGNVARGGYSIEDWDFHILLDEHSSSDAPGQIISRGRYRLSPRFIETLNKDNWYRFFNINHIAKEADIFLGPGIPHKYTKDGRVMTPEEFASGSLKRSLSSMGEAHSSD